MNKFENLVSPKTFAAFLALFILSGLAPAKAVAITPPNQRDGTSWKDVNGPVKMPSEVAPPGETPVPNPNEPPDGGAIKRPENGNIKVPIPAKPTITIVTPPTEPPRHYDEDGIEVPTSTKPWTTIVTPPTGLPRYLDEDGRLTTDHPK